VVWRVYCLALRHCENHFNQIADAMTNAGVNFDCKCNGNYYAYVYPNEPYNIYLCKVFWQAPLAGTDSKAGTLIHEMSHFTVVAGTDDVVYGQTAARNLAGTDPAAAITNADSHEYFAENTPPLP
jgi:peptidyl-Lys metalloendopeptidase